MLREFREFAVKGSVVDMAIGIMIGAAFNGVVRSFIDDLVMPPLGLLTGGLDFSDRFVVLREAVAQPGPYASLAEAREAGAAVLAYGQFAGAALSFLVVALVLFLVVRWINRLRRSDTPPAPNTKACPFCLSPVPLAASRCPECTSHLEEETVQP